METVFTGLAEICDPCMVEGNQNKAVGYCGTCKEFLCQECFQIHLRPKPCRNHKLLTKNEMPSMRSVCPRQSLSNEEGMNMCVEHSGKMVEYFCKVHNVLGCSTCMTLNHRLCNICHVKVSYNSIPLIEMPEYKRLKTKSEQLTREVQKSQRRIKALKNQATNTAEKAVKAVTSLRNKLVTEIDKNQRVLLKQIKQIKKEDVKNMDSILSDFLNIESGLKKMERELIDQENMKCKDEEAQLVVTKMVDTLKKLQKSSQQLQDRQTEVKSYHFSPSESFLKAFQNELKTFGLIVTTPTPPLAVKTPSAQSKLFKTLSTEKKSCSMLSEKQIGSNKQPKATAAQPNTVRNPSQAQTKPNESVKNSIKNPSPAQTIATESVKSTGKNQNPAQATPAESVKNTGKNPNQAQAIPTESVTKTGKNPNPAKTIPTESVKGEYITEFYIRTVSEKQASTITDMTMIETQQMAVCDFGNCCIKIIDLSNSQYSMILKMQLHSQPFGVTFTGQELAVTLPYLGVIGMFNDTKNFQFYRNIEVGTECRGIAYRDEKFFIGFNTSPGTVRIIKTTGEILRTLTMVGGDTFHHPCHLAAHPSLPTVYISDWQLIALGSDGSLVRKYRDTEFKELQGLSVSVDSNVYVCDRESNAVYLFSPAATSIQILLDAKQGIKGPHALMVTGKRNKKKLYVGMVESDYIKVFKISRTES